jgi:hypothetical protein
VGVEEGLEFGVDEEGGHVWCSVDSQYLASGGVGIMEGWRMFVPVFKKWR